MTVSEENYLQNPLQPLLLRLLQLCDDNREQIGGLRPCALGTASAVVLDQTADCLVQGDVVMVAMFAVMAFMCKHSAMDDVDVEGVSRDGDLGHARGLHRGFLMLGGLVRRGVDGGDIGTGAGGNGVVDILVAVVDGVWLLRFRLGSALEGHLGAYSTVGKAGVVEGDEP